MIATRKLAIFDGLELIRSWNIQQDAPPHFHEGYAIGIALKGLQTIILQQQQYLIAPGSIMLLNPRQVHAHKAFDNIAWSHKMLYLSPAYVSWLQQRGKLPGNERMLFKSPLVMHSTGYARFEKIYDQCVSGGSDERTLTKDFESLMTYLYAQLASPDEDRNQQDHERMKEVACLIELDFRQRLNLEGLAKKVHLSKYHLLRKFKSYMGVTPNEYLTIIRIERAKNYLLEGTSLVTAALETGFYDQSHFTQYFTHYTCFTPGEFQKACSKTIVVTTNKTALVHTDKP